MAVATISNGVITGVTLTCPGQGYLPGDVLTFSFGGGGNGTPGGSFQYTLQPGDVAANATGGVTKVGSGTLILSGSNSFTGGTTVLDGTLILENNQAVADGSSLTVGDASAFAPALAVPATAVASGPAIAPVPEPGTIVLLAVGLLLFIGRGLCRRRWLRAIGRGPHVGEIPCYSSDSSITVRVSRP